jgi:hypothetical protein
MNLARNATEKLGWTHSEPTRFPQALGASQAPAVRYGGARGFQANFSQIGAGWHDSADLVMPENITPIILPPYSPELNPAENVWEYLRKNKLANRLYETYEDIVEACCDAWNSLMAMPDRIASVAAKSWAKAS